MKDGLFTGRRDGIYTAGNGKALIVQELSRSTGIPLENIAAFGDSINDLPLLKCTGFPYAVSPGKALAGEAEKLGIPILNWSI